MRLVEKTSGAAALVVEQKNGGVRTFESRRWRALSAFTSRPVSDPQLSLSDGRVLGRTNRIH
jgi:hypothetical protein